MGGWGEDFHSYIYDILVIAVADVGLAVVSMVQKAEEAQAEEDKAKAAESKGKGGQQQQQGGGGKKKKGGK